MYNLSKLVYLESIHNGFELDLALELAARNERVLSEVRTITHSIQPTD